MCAKTRKGCLFSHQLLKGRAFAIQEAITVLALVAQKFDIIADDPTYELDIKSTLTIKPKGFKIRVVPRAGKPKMYAAPTRSVIQPEPGSENVLASSKPQESTQPLYVFYGSNTGSSESFAQRIASTGSKSGMLNFIFDRFYV